MTKPATFHFQSGRYTVGQNNQNNNNLVTVSITFPSPFKATPVVTANTINDPNWGSIADTFAVTVFAVTAAGFSANIYRVDNILNVVKGDGQGWDQNLQLGWIAQTE